MGADPITLSLIAVTAGTALSTVGTVASGIAANRAAKQQANEAEAAAAGARAKAAADSVVVARDKRRSLARQIAEINALGGQVGSGTSLSFAAEAARDGEMDILNTLAGGANRSARLRREATYTRSEGRQRMVQGFLGGAATAIDGYSRWQALQ